MVSSRQFENGVVEFRFRMHKLGVEGIKQAILRTWDEPEGLIVREVGFDIIEEQYGEDYVDQLYEELWDEAQWRKARIA